MAKCAKCGGFKAYHEYGGAPVHYYCIDELIKPAKNQFHSVKKMTDVERKKELNKILYLETEINKIKKSLEYDSEIPDGVKEVRIYPFSDKVEYIK